MVGCHDDTLLYKMLQDSPAIAAPMRFRHKLDTRNMREIRDVVEKYDIQLINAQASRDRYTAIFANLWYGLKLPIIHTRRQNPRSDGGWLQRKFYTKNTERIVVISEGLKKIFMEEKGYEAKDLKVIYNGMPPSFFDSFDPQKTEALKREYGIDGSFRLIGCVARAKRQQYLVRALPMLPKDVKIFFAGITDQDRNTGAIADELGVRDRIIWAGSVPREEIVNYYPMFDVFALPSHMDGFGLVLVEAMGMGIPIVATKFGGIVDVLQEQRNGLWYEKGNTEDFARQLNRVLEDQELRAELIAHGKRAAREDFSLEATITNYENFFQNIINSRQG